MLLALGLTEVSLEVEDFILALTFGALSIMIFDDKRRIGGTQGDIVLRAELGALLVVLVHGQVTRFPCFSMKIGDVGVRTESNEAAR